MQTEPTPLAHMIWNLSKLHLNNHLRWGYMLHLVGSQADKPTLNDIRKHVARNVWRHAFITVREEVEWNVE